MNFRSLCFASALLILSGFLFPALSETPQGCAVTKPPDHPFTPPSPWDADKAGSREFYYGTPDLWTVVYPNWHIHSGGKLPYFRRGFDAKTEVNSRLTVVARRLDGSAPLVWNESASTGTMQGNGAKMFMVTGIDIPTAGCWEITARYVPVPSHARILDNHGQILTYVVSVDTLEFPECCLAPR